MNKMWVKKPPAHAGGFCLVCLAAQGYTHAVILDLSKYFDTLNHEILIKLLRKDVKDERAVQMIKRYLKSSVMENGVVMETEEGSPQGGNLSPLLANISRFM